MPDPESGSERAEMLERYDIMDTPPEAGFDQIALEAALLTGAPVSTITMVDGHRQWFKAKTGIDRVGDPIGHSICAIAMLQDDPFVLNDAAADERFRNLRAVTENGVRFYAGVPLIVRDGTRVGTLCVLDTEARPGLEDEERAALEALARRTVAALEKCDVT